MNRQLFHFLLDFLLNKLHSKLDSTKYHIYKTTDFQFFQVESCQFFYHQELLKLVLRLKEINGRFYHFHIQEFHNSLFFGVLKSRLSHFSIQYNYFANHPLTKNHYLFEKE